MYFSLKASIVTFCVWSFQLLNAQTTVAFKHCKCTDTFEKTEPVLDGSYQRICNKKLIEQGEFIQGKKDGVWKTWSKKGNLAREFNYSNGVLNGDVKLYYPATGKKKLEGAFFNGKKTGTWNYYSDKNAIIKTGRYENGVPVGIWKVYDWNGKNELYVYDFDNKKYLKESEPTQYFKKAAILQNDNTEEWYILNRYEQENKASIAPVEGYILANDFYINLVEIPVDVWETFLQQNFNGVVKIQDNEIVDVKILNDEDFIQPSLALFVITNEANKLSKVEHSKESLFLLEYKISEALWLMGPWIGENDSIRIGMTYIVNQYVDFPGLKK